jgi:hypothetical protein
MHVIAIHDISDPDAFWGEASQLEMPDGVELPTVAPSPDGKRAICIWKADSVDTVRDLVDGASEGIASNEFFAVNDENAQGLPA